MLAKLIVVQPDKYDAWLRGEKSTIETTGF